MLWREKVERSSAQIQSMMKNVIKREQCKLACELPNVNILSKVTKFKVLLYLKKGSTDIRGKAPIMGRRAAALVYKLEKYMMQLV